MGRALIAVFQFVVELPYERLVSRTTALVMRSQDYECVGLAGQFSCKLEAADR
jgi:hypothetical protein